MLFVFECRTFVISSANYLFNIRSSFGENIYYFLFFAGRYLRFRHVDAYIYEKMNCI